MWVMLALMACGAQDGEGGKNGEAGAQGPAGPPGPPGPAGAPGGGYRWFDANGDPVTAGSDLVVFDDEGTAWFVTVEGEVAASTLTAMYYATPDCTGDLYVVGTYGARVAATSTDPDILAELPREFVVRGDRAPSIDLCEPSQRSGGGCSSINACVGRGVRVDDLVGVGSPPDDFAGPLHPEPAQ